MATGLPVIATRHSGLSEQVHDGVNGYLVPEGDYQLLAEAIIKMIQHPEIWPEMGQNGRDHVERNYNANTLLEKQIEMYVSLINLI